MLVYGGGVEDRLVRHFHLAYVKSARASGVEQKLMNAEEFRHLMDAGNIIVYAILNGDKIDCVFGLQLMHDGDGDYLSFLFIYGFADTHMDLLISTCFQTWYAHRDTKELKQVGRLLIVGRKAWAWRLRKAGVEYERDGQKMWIHE
ncbi:MAG: hypothetical protein AAAC47_00665, partial [Pararhizobium sp.]